MPKKKVAVKNKKDNKNAIILSENEKMLKDTLHNYYHKQDILFSEYDINAANLSQIWNDFQNGKLPQITECYKKVRVNEKYKFNDKDFEFLTNHLKRIYPLLDDEIISSAKATIISHHGAYQTFSSQKTRQTINDYYNEQFNTDKLDSTKFSQMWIDFQLKKIKIPTKVFPHDGLKFLQSDFKEFSDTIKQCYPEIKEEDFNKIKNNSEEHLKKIYKEIKNSSSSTGYSHNAKVEYLERYYKLLQRFNAEKGYNSNISDEQALVNILKDHCREGKELNRITPIFVSFLTVSLSKKLSKELNNSCFLGLANSSFLIGNSLKRLKIFV